MVMTFDYYYGAQAEQFNFIRIPKAMIVDPMFADLSVNAKLLYGVLLDRMNLSMKNRWFDSENRVYIIYQIAEIMEDFNFSKKTAVRYLNELENFGLVEKKRRGLGLPSLLDEIAVFEGAIDLLSYVDLYSSFDINLLALGMLSDEPLNTVLKEHPNITKIRVCLDNDEPGRETAKKIVNKYRLLGYEVIDFPPREEFKDYNDYLKACKLCRRCEEKQERGSR